jgi:hypothetical protein
MMMILKEEFREMLLNHYGMSAKEKTIFTNMQLPETPFKENLYHLLRFFAFLIGAMALTSF